MSKSDEKLEEYEEKRDRTKSPEPFRDDEYEADVDGPLFVIQEHDASTHHFDFRLEIGGVLASWSVPKGPSTDPSEKRLAIRTEDHPKGYADFEGVIPEGEYGGGTVSIWDRGPYRNLEEEDEEGEEGDGPSMEEQLEDGHLTVWLEGEKLRGGYALTRFRGGPDDEEEQESWLLVKMDDEEADARRKPTSTEPRSVKSGRRLEDVAAEEDPTSFDQER